MESGWGGSGAVDPVLIKVSAQSIWTPGGGKPGDNLENNLLSNQ